jgi:RNA polymerase sigma-70 factor (ECF subfamily)
LTVELRVRIEEAIAALPPAQREVIVLHDVEGFFGDDVGKILGVSSANERVLLHRARAKIRATLERHFDGSRS